MEDEKEWQRVRRMNGRPEGWVRREEKLLNTHLQRGEGPKISTNN